LISPLGCPFANAQTPAHSASKRRPPGRPCRWPTVTGGPYRRQAGFRARLFAAGPLLLAPLFAADPLLVRLFAADPPLLLARLLAAGPPLLARLLAAGPPPLLLVVRLFAADPPLLVRRAAEVVPRAAPVVRRAVLVVRPAAAAPPDPAFFAAAPDVDAA
jgi:hypothetical protein